MLRYVTLRSQCESVFSLREEMSSTQKGYLNVCVLDVRYTGFQSCDGWEIGDHCSPQVATDVMNVILYIGQEFRLPGSTKRSHSRFSLLNPRSYTTRHMHRLYLSLLMIHLKIFFN